jgi:hypothetical protein
MAAFGKAARRTSFWKRLQNDFHRFRSVAFQPRIHAAARALLFLDVSQKSG